VPVIIAIIFEEALWTMIYDRIYDLTNDLIQY